jgi:hypothetical protein
MRKIPNAAQNSQRRAIRQTPTHKTAKQPLYIRADKIRPSCLACRARKNCTGYSARNPESKLQTYFYIALFCAERAKIPSEHSKF